MRIVAAKPLGTMPVYDLSVSHEHHSFVHESGVVLHNCGFVIADRPIHEFIPLTTISDTKTTQYTAEWVEWVGGVKIDLLGLNSLRDISDAIQLIQSRLGEPVPEELYIEGRGLVPKARLIPFNGKFYDVWDLPHSPEVYADIAAGRTETVFQFNTNSARQWLGKFNDNKSDGTPMLNSIADLAIFTALDRPGPLDAMVGQREDGTGGHNMLVEYANRASKNIYTGRVAALEELLPDTYGVIIFQEDLQYVYQQLSGSTGAEAEQFRRDVAKKKVEEVESAYEKFIGPASEKIGKEEAEQVWAQLKTFAQYGFCKAHAYSYVIIGYACAFLKHHYPVEWWTGVLRNADKEEIATEFWKHCGHMIDFPDVNLSGDNWEIQGDRIRAPLGLLKGIGPTASEELNASRPYESIQDLANKIEQTKIDKTTFVDGKKRNGRSALNIGVIARLIVTGALDSLFEKGMSDAEKLDQFLDAQRIAQKKKRKAAVPDKYAMIDELSAYQMRKEILPIYSTDLAPILARLEPEIVGQGASRLCYFGWGEEPIPFVTGSELATIQEQALGGGALTVAGAGYLMETREFGYHGDKRALELTIDLGNGVYKGVLWPPRGEKVYTNFGIEPGSILIVVLSRWREDRPFSVAHIEKVRSPGGSN